MRATLALTLAAADRLTPALEEARRAVELEPDTADAQIALGTVLRLQDRIDEALSSCRRAAAIEPDAPSTLVALAGVLREAGEYDKALDLYGQAIDLDHEAIVPQFGAAATVQQASRLREAARFYAVLLTHWDYARTRALQGAAAVQVARGDCEGALETYQEITLPSNGSLPTILTLYGKGYCLMQLERPAEAEYFLTRLIERLPHDYDGPARGREFLFRAYQDLIGYFEDRGRGKKVETLLREACDRPQTPTRLARRLADLLERTGDRDEAAEVLQDAIAGADPSEDALEMSDTAIALAQLRSDEGKHPIRPATAAGQALRLAAERIAPSPIGVAHYRLARALSLARDREGALASLARAREHGYLPRDRAAAEPDFTFLRDEAAFQELIAP